MTVKYFCDMCNLELAGPVHTREFHIGEGGKSHSVKTNTAHLLCEPCVRRIVGEGKHYGS